MPNLRPPPPRPRYRWPLRITARLGRGIAPALRVVLGLAFVTLLGGCTVIFGHRDLRNTNDELRAENMDLRQRVEDLSEQLAGLERLLEVERERREVELPPGVQPPTVARVAFGRYSGPVDTTSDDAPDALRLYLRTFDARGRFTQTVASVRVTVVAPRPGQAAATLATAEFDPRSFDRTYRSGFTGTHYTLQVPFDDPLPSDARSITVHLALEDLQTGYTHRADASFALPEPGRPATTAGLSRQ